MFHMKRVSHCDWKLEHVICKPYSVLVVVSCVGQIYTPNSSLKKFCRVLSHFTEHGFSKINWPNCIFLMLYIQHCTIQITNTPKSADIYLQAGTVRQDTRKTCVDQLITKPQPNVCRVICSNPRLNIWSAII